MILFISVVHSADTLQTAVKLWQDANMMIHKSVSGFGGFFFFLLFAENSICHGKNKPNSKSGCSNLPLWPPRCSRLLYGLAVQLVLHPLSSLVQQQERTQFKSAGKAEYSVSRAKSRLQFKNQCTFHNHCDLQQQVLQTWTSDERHIKQHLALKQADRQFLLRNYFTVLHDECGDGAVLPR